MLLIFSLLLVATATSRVIKVISLARHGNRAPNPQAPWICPKAHHLLDAFNQHIDSKQRAALTKFGMAENWEAGQYFKNHYVGKGKLLEDEAYYDDGSTFFFSERMNRNIVSTIALTKGMYPDGTGQRGFQLSRPNFVPISTSQPFQDTLMNTPRDGPCKPVYKKDLDKYNAQHAKTILHDNKKIMTDFSEACGFDFADFKKLTDKPLIWNLKAVVDVFSFAKNEGLDPTLNGTLSMEVLGNITRITKAAVNDSRFGKKYQITYWIGRFLDDALFANIKNPGNRPQETFVVVGNRPDEAVPWRDSPLEWFYHNRFLLFLNHRELLTSVIYVFQLDYVLEESLPPGSMLIWELREDDETKEEFIRLMFWKPSQPDWEEKHKLDRKNVTADESTSLYDKGVVKDVFPPFCKIQGRCTLLELMEVWEQWKKNTGTYEDICGLSQDKHLSEYFSEVESSMNEDGDDEDGWRSAFEKKLFRMHAENFASRPKESWPLADYISLFGLASVVASCLVFIIWVNRRNLYNQAEEPLMDYYQRTLY